MKMTPARVDAFVASAWNTVPHACDDVAMTPAKAAKLSKAVRLQLLQGYRVYAQNPNNQPLYTVTEIDAAIAYEGGERDD